MKALGLRTVIVPAKALAEANRWDAAAFGVEPYLDEPFYVGSTSAATSSA